MNTDYTMKNTHAWHIAGIVRPERERPSRIFVNVYRDDQGRFISDDEYPSYEEAFLNKDDLKSYVETVEFIRPLAHGGEPLPAEASAQSGSGGLCNCVNQFFGYVNCGHDCQLNIESQRGGSDKGALH